MTDAAAPVHGDSGRLVDYQQALVLVKNLLEHRRGTCLRGRRRPGADACRKYAYLVAFPQLVFGLDAAAVDADLTAAQQPIHAAFGHTGQFAAQEIVDALARAIRADVHFADLGQPRAGV